LGSGGIVAKKDRIYERPYIRKTKYIGGKMVGGEGLEPPTYSV
jgi:hypothetical protein